MVSQQNENRRCVPPCHGVEEVGSHAARLMFNGPINSKNNDHQSNPGLGPYFHLDMKASLARTKSGSFMDWLIGTLSGNHDFERHHIHAVPSFRNQSTCHPSQPQP